MAKRKKEVCAGCKRERRVRPFRGALKCKECIEAIKDKEILNA